MESSLRYGKILPHLLDIDAGETVRKSAEAKVRSIGLSFQGDVSRSLRYIFMRRGSEIASCRVQGSISQRRCSRLSEWAERNANGLFGNEVARSIVDGSHQQNSVV